MYKNSTDTRQNQDGFVSIIVSMIIISILSLMLLGFARLMEHEKRQSLDRQLSTQAYYAAESGVNDASKWVETNGTTTITNCNTPGNAFKAAYTENLGPDGVVKYTCVLIDPAPTELPYSVSENKSVLVPVTSANGVDLASISVDWTDQENQSGAGFVSAAQADHHLLPAKGDVDSLDMQTGLVRMSIIPTADGLISRGSLISQQATYFLYPRADSVGEGSQAYGGQGSVDEGRFIDAKCNSANTPRKCRATVTGLGTLNTNTIYLRLKGIYRSSSVVVSAKDVLGNTVELANAQAVIDSTGKANDVLRRIVVHKDLSSNYDIPEAALTSFDTLCKRFEVWPGGAKFNSNPGCDLTN